jgi:selenocysteine lyase/cysteine desulfurase
MDKLKETSPDKMENNMEQKTHSRRRFLCDAAALSLTPVALNLAMPTLALGSVRDTELPQRLRDYFEKWQQVRDMFSFSDGNVPMNAANLCPSFKQVADRVFFLTRKLNEDVSFNNRESYKILLDLTRKKIAASLNVSPDNLALVRNTSEANCVINNGLNFQHRPSGPPDNIVVWEENHATNMGGVEDSIGAWDIRKTRWDAIWGTTNGIDIRIVKTDSFRIEGKLNVERITEAFKSKVDDNTRLVTFTEISNASGIKLPATEICDAVHGKNSSCKVHVDGAQSWGARNLDLKGMGCDSFSASSHKWFCGPKETGILYVKPDFAQELTPLVWGYNGLIVVPEEVPNNAHRFETLGQRDDAAISAMGEAIDIHNRIGRDNIETRVRNLASLLKEKLVRVGVTLKTPMDPEFSHGVVVVELAPDISQCVVDTLYNKYGIAGSTTGGLRLCPHIYNTEEHITRAVEGVESALQSC